MGQDRAYNDTTNGLVISQAICDRGKEIQAAQLREANEKAEKQQAAVVKEGEERSRLLALRKSQLLKLKELIQDKASLQNIDPEEAFEWHLDAMLVANIRDLYRACTISHTNIAYFNGVTKSVAYTVSKDECIAYIIQITEQDMKGELGDGNDMDGVLQNDEDGELEEDEEDEEDGMDL